MQQQSIGKQEVGTKINKFWANLQSMAKWSNELCATFERVKKSQTQIVQESPDYKGNKAYIQPARVPSMCTEEHLVLGILLAAQEDDDLSGLTTPKNNVDWDWANRVNKNHGFGSGQLAAMLQRAFFRKKVKKDELQSVTGFDSNFSQFIEEAQSLSNEVSQGVIDVRHIVAAYLGYNHEYDSIRHINKEGIQKPQLFEGLKDHVRESKAAQYFFCKSG